MRVICAKFRKEVHARGKHSPSHFADEETEAQRRGATAKVMQPLSQGSFHARFQSPFHSCRAGNCFRGEMEGGCLQSLKSASI